MWISPPGAALSRGVSGGGALLSMDSLPRPLGLSSLLKESSHHPSLLRLTWSGPLLLPNFTHFPPRSERLKLIMGSPPILSFSFFFSCEIGSFLAACTFESFQDFVWLFLLFLDFDTFFFRESCQLTADPEFRARLWCKYGVICLAGGITRPHDQNVP